MTYNMLQLNRTANILNICKRRCDDHKVNLEVSRHITVPCTNQGTIYLPALPVGATENDLAKIHGFIVHECGHHTRPQAFAILKAAAPPEHLQIMMNIVEDDGMEREVATKWLGDAQALSKTNKLITQQNVKAWKDSAAFDNTTDFNPLIALCLYQTSRSNWDPSGIDGATAVVEQLPEEAKALLKELVDEGWVNRFRATETPRDCWNLACDLIKRMYPDHDQEQYEKLRDEGLAGADQYDKAAQHGSRQPMNSVTKGVRDEAQSPAQGTEVTDQDEDEDKEVDVCREGTTISWKDCLLSDHVVNELQKNWDRKDVGGAVGIDWTGWQSDAGFNQPLPPELVQVQDVSKSTASAPWGSNAYQCSDLSTDAKLANQVRRYIQAQTRIKAQRDQQYGKLDKGSLIKLGLPPINGGEYNKKIFYDMGMKQGLNTALFILVDWSGSMMGQKMHVAAKSAARLTFLFENTLKVPTSLATFSNKTSECNIGMIKKYGERTPDRKEMARRFSLWCKQSCGNNDSDALYWAYWQLLQRKEGRRILMVLSDGCPTGGIGDPHRQLQGVTRLIQREGLVDLIGIGIKSKAVENYYDNHKVVNDVSCLGQVILEVLKENFNANRR